MIVKVNKNLELDDDYIDIQYREMTMMINQIIDLAGSNKPYLIVKHGGTSNKIDIQDIYYVETVDKKYFIYTKFSVYETNQSLTELEQSLRELGFIRINKSTIVNIYKVAKIKADTNMRILAYLLNGEAVTVTRHYRKSFYRLTKSISLQIQGGKK